MSALDEIAIDLMRSGNWRPDCIMAIVAAVESCRITDDMTRVYGTRVIESLRKIQSEREL